MALHFLGWFQNSHGLFLIQRDFLKTRFLRCMSQAEMGFHTGVSHCTMQRFVRAKTCFLGIIVCTVYGVLKSTESMFSCYTYICFCLFIQRWKPYVQGRDFQDLLGRRKHKFSFKISRNLFFSRAPPDAISRCSTTSGAGSSTTPGPGSTLHSSPTDKPGAGRATRSSGIRSTKVQWTVQYSAQIFIFYLTGERATLNLPEKDFSFWG